MKLILISASVVFILAFSSCQKCVTCIPYYYHNGTIGAVDTTVSLGGSQAVKLCDKTDITAYESLKIADSRNDSIRFVCQ
jgi:hypothetical protein